MSTEGLVITGIGELTTWDADRPVIEDAALVCGSDGLVTWVGADRELPSGTTGDHVDAAGRAVIPGFVDCHTHLVFGGERSAEWEARMCGDAYRAGGIRTTVLATRAATSGDLARRSAQLAAEALRSGTTTLEIKSGYGLDVVTERKMLEVAGGLTPETTFLGAHVVPTEFATRPDDYVDLVCGAMLAECRPLARWVDVFCEQGAFDLDQSRAVLSAGRDAGLGLRMHASQLGPGEGVRLAVEMGAASVDHCTHLRTQDIEALAGGGTVAVLLPGAEFSTRSPYPDARRLLDAGVRVALASDCNPGSSFTSSMPLMVAMAVRDMYMAPGQALWSATAGGAAALQRDDIGRLVPGCRADLVMLEAPSARWLGYRPGVNLVSGVWRGGIREA